MKYLLLAFLTTVALADAKKETVNTINKGASNIDAEARKIIGAGKDVFNGKKTIKKNTSGK